MKNDEDGRHPDGSPSSEVRRGDSTPATDAWDRMVEAFQRDAPTGAAPPWLEQKVMAEIHALPEPGLWSAIRDWLMSPRAVRVSPLAGALVVALFAIVIVLPDSGALPLSPPTGTLPAQRVASGAGPEASVVYVQFELEAPAAHSVAVAGDFSDWEPGFTLSDTNGDGVWTGRVPVQPGVHAYMFLIDGTSWQTDPRADRYQDDGFGNQNAVLAVAASE